MHIMIMFSKLMFQGVSYVYSQTDVMLLTFWLTMDCPCAPCPRIAILLSVLMLLMGAVGQELVSLVVSLVLMKMHDEKERLADGGKESELDVQECLTQLDMQSVDRDDFKCWLDVSMKLNGGFARSVQILERDEPIFFSCKLPYDCCIGRQVLFYEDIVENWPLMHSELDVGFIWRCTVQVQHFLSGEVVFAWYYAVFSASRQVVQMCS